MRSNTAKIQYLGISIYHNTIEIIICNVIDRKTYLKNKFEVKRLNLRNLGILQKKLIFDSFLINSYKDIEFNKLITVIQ